MLASPKLPRVRDAQRRWEMVSASARRKNQKAAAEAAFAAATAAVTAAAAAAAAAGGSGAAPPPQPWEDVEENAFKVDGELGLSSYLDGIISSLRLATKPPVKCCLHVSAVQEDVRGLALYVD